MKTRLLPALAVALLALAPADTSSAQDWAKAIVDKSPRHLEWVTIKHDGRDLGAYVGYPEVKDKATTVLVIHEIYGHSDWVRALVDDLAAAGYIAIAPDLLWGAGAKGGGTAELTSAEIGQKINALPAAQITADLSAALDYITKQPASNGKVVVAGFCWGGGKSFSFATNNQMVQGFRDTEKSPSGETLRFVTYNPAVQAALVFYGSPPPAAEMARITVPVYGFYAENDARITGGVAATTGLMKTAGKTYEPVTYAGAGHGFMRAGEDPAGTPANKKAREDSWKRWMEIMKAVTTGAAMPGTAPAATPAPAPAAKAPVPAPTPAK